MTREEALKWLTIEKTGMTLDEAIDHLYTYSSTLGSGQTTQAQHEEAKRVAIDVMRKYQKQERALDKIRSEIADYGSIWVAYAITGKRDKDIEQLVSDVLSQAKKQVLEIIDKYKAEVRGEMKAYEITAEMKLSLKNFIAESREVAEALNEFADNLEQIEKKYAKPQESEGEQ